MFIKLKNAFFKILLCCFLTTFSFQLQSLTIEDVTKASEVRSYCLPKNINRTPLDIKLEQMLFLGWNKDSINNITINYLGKHHIGGMCLNTKFNKNSEKVLQDFLQNLTCNYSIPSFIYINDKNLGNNTSEINENLEKLNKLGVNIIKIPIKNGNVVPESMNISDEAFSPIFQFIKDSNKNKIVTIIDNFKANFTNKRLNVYSLLVKAGKFNQIIIPYNGMESSVDTNNNYSLSEKAIKIGIRRNLNFNGVIINNILSEPNILKKLSLEEVIIKAIKADNDMIFYNGGDLLINQKFVEDFKSIVKNAIKNGKLTTNDIDNSYRRIINLKSQFYIVPKENFC